MILEPLSALYGAVATWRRRWYAGDPSRRRRLARPVISVGNLRVGGSGKTPVVAHLAQLLAGCGEHPAILSRGYARERERDGVTVVSDGTDIRTGLAEAGDEPLLLARALPGVPVLVCADRAMAGRFAEDHLGATVHLLDDGFQHLQLTRDVDLLVIDLHDLEDQVLPAGPLREPVTSAAAADAVFVSGVDAERATDVAAQVGVQTGWAIVRSLCEPTLLQHTARAEVIAPELPVFAVAGIARPQRFFDDLSGAGWRVVGNRTYRDHHRFTQRDVDQLTAEAEASGARFVLTTAKDAVRLEALTLRSLPFAIVPLQVSIEPAEPFRRWIADRLVDARLRLDLEQAGVAPRDRARNLSGAN